MLSGAHQDESRIQNKCKRLSTGTFVSFFLKMFLNGVYITISVKMDNMEVIYVAFCMIWKVYEKLMLHIFLLKQITWFLFKWAPKPHQSFMVSFKRCLNKFGVWPHLIQSMALERGEGLRRSVIIIFSSCLTGWNTEPQGLKL